MSDFSQLGPFSNIDHKMLEEALSKSTVSAELAKMALDIRKAASRALHIKEPTMQIGIRSVSLNLLAKHLSEHTGIAPETTKRLLEEIHARPIKIKTNEELLSALNTISSDPKEIAIETIVQAKELFDALKSRRFVSEKKGAVKDATGKDVAPYKGAEAQYGANWKNSKFNRWLELNPADKKLFEAFCKDFGNREIVNLNTSHFLKEIIGTYIKLDSNQNPVISHADEAKLHTYLTLHQDLTTFLVKNCNILIGINDRYTSKSPMFDELERFVDELAKKPGVTEDEINKRSVLYIKELLKDSRCSEFDRITLNSLLEEYSDG